jgi:leucyl-tRNA synthetase
MPKYDHAAVERKWQEEWKKHKAFQPSDTPDSQKKRYVLDMFPYPSSAGLHVGHPEGYTATDIVCRYLRLRGHDVLHPMGWDAFGLPAENFAIKSGKHPRETTEASIANFKRQIQSLGFSYDWSREVNTSDPGYYRWTQWLFEVLYRRGLAYKKMAPVNWCPKDQTVLANEQVVDGACERCGTTVEKKELAQWFFKVTAYAEELLAELDNLDWPEPIKTMQRNWIGRSEGAEIDFPLVTAEPIKKVLLATSNPSKVERTRRLVREAGLAVEVVTPQEIGIEPIEVHEDGDVHDNSLMKAQAYAGKTDLPILGMDTGLLLEGVTMDPAKVRRNALEGADEDSLSQEEIAQRMQKHYRGIAAERGGEVDGYFLDILTLVLPDGSTRVAESRRELVFVDELKGKVDPHFPLRNIFKSRATGKFAAEHSADEDLLDLRPYTRALTELLQPAIRVFTTRPDTLFGVTYVVLAPEHPWVSQLTVPEKMKDVDAYVRRAGKLKDIERTATDHEKTGVFTGSYAINPVNGERVPIWIADYVLATYGTGAVMAVPAHDERDFAFARAMKLPRKNVIKPPSLMNTPAYETVASPGAWGHLGNELESECWTGEGTLMNSAPYDGLEAEVGAEKIVHDLAARGGARKTVQYKLRDWLISRQRYWGAPIPVVYCDDHGEQLVPEKDLPVELPDDVDFRPTGESPLARSKDFAKGAKCPVCKKTAQRETDTMDTFVDSSWYFLRYCDPHNKKKAFDHEKVAAWLPVDVYVGGAEHAVLHLLYSRFVYKALADAQELPQSVGREPFKKLRNQGLILGEDGEKMSKSRGNVVNPDEIVSRYGADAFRLFEMFLGPLEMAKPWSMQGIVGMTRFLDRVWQIHQRDSRKHVELNPDFLRLLNQSIKKVGEDIESFRFNTAISQLMVLSKAFDEQDGLDRRAFGIFLRLLLPFAPHLASECLNIQSQDDPLAWPPIDPAMVEDLKVEITIQINGKRRAVITMPRGATQDDVVKAALADEKIKKYVTAEPKKVIFVQDKIMNFVV